MKCQSCKTKFKIEDRIVAAPDNIGSLALLSGRVIKEYCILCTKCHLKMRNQLEHEKEWISLEWLTSNSIFFSNNKEFEETFTEKDKVEK